VRVRQPTSILLHLGLAAQYWSYRSLPRSEFIAVFLFYELELIPLYLLIAGGGSRRGYAATKFLIYTAVSGILILSAFLGLTWLSGSSSFDYQPLLAQALGQQFSARGALGGISDSLVPFHTWLPDARRSLDPGFSTPGWGVAEVGNLWVAAVWFGGLFPAWQL